MQTQEVGIKSHVKVTMRSDAEMLEEVMVVAFGTAKKSAFTGSAKVIGAEKLEQFSFIYNMEVFPQIFGSSISICWKRRTNPLLRAK